MVSLDAIFHSALPPGLVGMPLHVLDGALATESPHFVPVSLSGTYIEAEFYVALG